MQITRNSLETSAGPNDRFTGTVYVDTIAAPAGSSRLSASSVHFTPGARTAWHTHPHGQTIWVLEGIGICQRRGGPVELIRPGDRVFFEPGEEHWHGAHPDRFMTHIASFRSTTKATPPTGATTSATTSTRKRRESATDAQLTAADGYGFGLSRPSSRPADLRSTAAVCARSAP